LAEQHVQIIQAGQDPQFELLDELVSQADVMLDGILGTGFRPPLKPEIARLIDHLISRAERPFIVAVDCPSGVDCDSGECAPQVMAAELTICLAAVKSGLLRFPAFEKVGELVAVDIGLPTSLDAWKTISNQVAHEEMVARILPKRPLDAHKGTFGTALVTAGSINYTGAAYLAAKAAYRIGAGLVQIAVPGPLHTVLAGQIPEATWLILPHEMGVIAEGGADVLLKNLDRADALLIGPGLGTEETTGAFLRKLLSGKIARTSRGNIGFIVASSTKEDDLSQPVNLPPLVFDADALKLLARLPDWPKLLTPATVLTPHPGEMAVLTGKKIGDIQANRLEIALQYSQQWGVVVVLKGALTVVASPQQGAVVIPIATPALARAGTGDVLSGIITGLLAQGVEPFDASIAGAWIHAQAGLEAQSYLECAASVLATDVLESIPTVISRLY
jgi:NAD(P)H-hydrate epimerase